MAPKPSSSSSWRDSWQAKTTQRSPSSRRVRRIVLSVAALLLVGMFSALLVFYLWPYPKLRVIGVSVGDYDALQAPPLLFAQEGVERLTALSSENSDRDRSQGLGNLTVEALRTKLRELVQTVRSGDCLVMYLAAHGIQSPDAAGNGDLAASPTLLCAEYQAAGHTGLYRVDDLLDVIERQPARLKILALDCGGMTADPRAGLLVNEFSRSLAESLRKRKDSRLWVVLSNDMFERSHISSASKASAFSHFLSAGLSGAADGAVGRTPNSQIELDELTHYVQVQVARWVWEVSKKTQSQTPVVLHAGEGAISDTKRVPATFVTLLTRSTPIGHVQRGEVTGLAALAHRAPLPFLAIDAPMPPADGKTPAPAKVPEAAKSAEHAPVAKPPVDEPKPPRKSVLQQLTEEAGVASRRTAGGSWTPVDYAPHLWRAYINLLDAYRDRSQGGEHFNSGAGAQELEDQVRALDQIDQSRRQCLDQFNRGPARESYDAFPVIASAVRLRDDLLFRSAELIYGSVNGWQSDSREPRAASEDCRRLNEALAQLQLLIASLEDAPESFAQEPDASTLGQWGKRIDSYRRELDRILKPSDLRIDPANAQSPAMWTAPLAESGDEVLPKSLVPAQAQALVERVRCELELVRAIDRDEQGNYKRLREALKTLEAASPDELDAFCQASRACGGAIGSFYRDLPSRIAELRRDNSTKSWRQAEVALRLLSPRDAQRTQELMRQPTPSGRRNPVSDVPMLAVPSRIELAGPDNARAGGAQGPVAVGLDASVYTWELRSTRSLGEGVQYTVDYDPALLDVKDRAKQPLPPRSSRPLAVTDGSRSATVSLLIAGRGDVDTPAALTLEATIAGSKIRSVTPFALPEQTHLELTVRGGEGTWHRLPASGAITDRFLVRPFVLGKGRSTDYELQIKDRSGRGTKIACQLLAIDREELASGLPAVGQLLDPRVKPSNAWTSLAKIAEMSVPAGGDAVPLVATPAKPDAAAGVPPPPAAPSPTSTPDLGALVFVAEYTPSDGKPKRYVAWVELQCRHPETYLQDPDVNFNDRDSMIHVFVRPKEQLALPLGGARVALEAEDRRLQLVRPRSTVQQAGDAVELLASAPRDPQATVALWVSADAWPRAFLYNDVHCWLSRKADRTSLQLNEISHLTAVGRQGDKPVQPLAYGGRGGDDTGWLFPRLDRLAIGAQVDMPPNTPREEYRCRISIARQGTAAEANRPLAEFHADRLQRVNLLPQTAPSSLQFEAEASDLSLDIDPEDYANQPSRLDIEIYALTSERSPERRRVESRSLFIDTQPPEVRLQDQNRQTLEVEQDKPLAVLLTAIDKPNGGIARVELAFQRENGALVNPVQAFAIREGSDTYQATVPTKDRPPGAHHELWYQATDRVGNVSPATSVSVFIKPPSPMASGAAAVKNSIRGVVRRAGRGIPGIKVELSGQTTKSTSSAADGSFAFTDLSPGAYTLSARGFIAGTGFKSPDTPATVAPPPAAPPFVILELQ